MNKKQAYLDALNAGRRRRPTTSIEELNRTLAELEGHISSRAAPAAEDDAPIAPDTTLQAAARVVDDARMRRDSVEAAGGIADELRELRSELNAQVSAGLEREFASLRDDMVNAPPQAAGACQAAELRGEVDRLAEMIQTLAARGDEVGAQSLRVEMEEIRSTIDQLAREETVRSVGQKWDEFDQRWTDFTQRFEANTRDLPGDSLKSLHTRLEQIGEAVGTLPNTPSMRSLDEKLKILATAMDRFAEQQEPLADTALEIVEERLDEISRAIAASAGAVKSGAVDSKPFERIEARIGSLAKQIDELLEERPNDAVARQIEAMTARIDELAVRSSMPESTVTRLAEQMALIAEKVQAGNQAPDMSAFEERFAAISAALEQRHGDAMAMSEKLFSDLESRIETLAGQFEQRMGELPRIDVINGFEKRLDGISRRLETTTANLAAIDPDLVRSLEAQVASLSRSITAPAAAMEQFEDLGPRLERLEQTIADNHTGMIEAARKAAEDALRSFDDTGAEATAVKGLAEDLRSLEALARRSDDRNTRTFEAIHDTLLKIVDRLGALDTPDAEDADTPVADARLDLSEAPSLETDISQLGFDMPAEDPVARSAKSSAVDAADAAAHEAPQPTHAEQRSMLGGISRALRGKRKDQTTADTATAAIAHTESGPVLDLDAPLDPRVANEPLEPGTATPDLDTIMRRVRGERQVARTGPKEDADTAKSDFIAAARRAAQAAAAEAESVKNSPDKGKGQRFNLGGLLRSRNKAMMMGIVAITLALAGLQAGKLLSTGEEVAAGDTQDATTTASIDADVVNLEATPVADAKVRDLTTLAKRPGAQANGDATGAPIETVAASASTTSNVEAPTTTAVSFDPHNAFIPPMAGASMRQDVPVAQEQAAEDVAIAAAPTVVEVPLEAGPAPLREAAEAGDAKAYFEIGNRYAEGRGVEADMTVATNWYRAAAEAGLVPAQYRLANILEKGNGVDRDMDEAVIWYESAAASGNASAMHNLAVLHAMGAAGKVDNTAAAKYFAQAADLGVRDSQFNMAILAAKGVGMPQDLKAAYKWFALLADAGDEDAAAKRDEVAGVLSASDLEQAKQSTKLWEPGQMDPTANLVDIPNAWAESQETTASVDVGQAIMRVQAILNANGYDAGQPDGIMGQRTKSAISAFQKDNDMEPTGQVDEPLVRALLATT